ncbi:hypothetical protein NDU88_004535 [Pleurodeles waltl]|uniref:Cyclic nucleotide-binding domain-containing protein n=1 Tax=Pleurodeles waltl TaxID=8319 RepID=A0AAV7PCT7_PLEWA|nr:hypothetical protein NDU88_004535 [Pleurodeles waltl]
MVSAEGKVRAAMRLLVEAGCIDLVVSEVVRSRPVHRMQNGAKSGEYGLAHQPRREWPAWCRATSRATLWGLEVSTLHRLATALLGGGPDESGPAQPA